VPCTYGVGELDFDLGLAASNAGDTTLSIYHFDDQPSSTCSVSRPPATSVRQLEKTPPGDQADRGGPPHACRSALTATSRTPFSLV
jgi:hypothetical protein